MAIASMAIIAIIILKYKPTYVVTMSGEEIGYTQSGTKLNEKIETEIIGMEGKNIDFVSLDEMPSYELKLISRTQETNEEEMMLALKEKAKGLGIKNVHNMKKETLIAKIKEIEDIEVEKENPENE